MKLKMSGHDRRTVKYVSEATLKKSGNSKGYCDASFDWDDATDPVTIKVTIVISINKDLDPAEKKAVLKHEEQHFKDMKSLSVAMKKKIEAAMKAGQDPQIGDRIEWWKYDQCVKSAAFHRSAAAAGYSTEICSKPGSKRPA